MSKQGRLDTRLQVNQGILNKIAKIDHFKGLWHGSIRFSPQILGRMKQWVIIASAGASTRIEGSQMTDQEIARFLRGFKGKHPTSRDEQEVAGYADLIGRIFDHWQSIKLSENWILQCHDILLHYSEKDQSHKGIYKQTPNTVVMINAGGEQVTLFAPTPPHLVRPEMQQIIDWTNTQREKEETHPLLIIANFIFEFLAIHPFKDGNGRLSRALTNLLLLQAGYSYIPYISLDEIIEQNKAEYYLALRATQKKHKTTKENLTPWLDYLLNVLLEQTEQAYKLMQSDQPEKLLSETQTRIYHLFDNSQELGIAEINILLNNQTPRPSIKQALSRLVTLKLLERIGQARSSRYKKMNG